MFLEQIMLTNQSFNVIGKGGSQCYELENRGGEGEEKSPVDMWGENIGCKTSEGSYS